MEYWSQDALDFFISTFPTIKKAQNLLFRHFRPSGRSRIFYFDISDHQEGPKYFISTFPVVRKVYIFLFRHFRASRRSRIFYFDIFERQESPKSFILWHPSFRKFRNFSVCLIRRFIWFEFFLIRTGITWIPLKFKLWNC